MCAELWAPPERGLSTSMMEGWRGHHGFLCFRA